ncbi:acyloxyacyl hydrolase [Flammeovirgaceae bacterium SG7u.111]|nr:acyloxyacyl hydrolase [Flammeovirgaceae bacterium SG7u.132]WPO33277.1 acyloxyacyl hydrolase [Flammeovirgaceae bacterium SG7u.111]
MNNKSLLILVGIFCLPFWLFAQQDKAITYGINARQGYLIKHRKEIDPSLENRFPRGIEFFYHVKTNGDKPWQHEWNFPGIGFSAGWFNLDNPEVLGDMYYATIYFQKFLIKKPSKHQLSFKIAPGISYSTKIYDEETNPTNILVSTKFNTVMEGNFLYHYQFSPKWRINTGLTFTHYSNGAVKKPNKGVNIPSFTLGIAHTPNPERFKINENVKFSYEKGVSYDLSYGFGWKAADIGYDPDFAWTISFNGIKRTGPKTGWMLGTDLVYNSSIPKVIKKDDAELFRTGITFGHHLFVSKINLVTQIGYYIYRPEKDLDEPIYLRWGLKYYPSKRVFASMMLKTHYGKADLIEWGLGYTFGKK